MSLLLQSYLSFVAPSILICVFHHHLAGCNIADDAINFFGNAVLCPAFDELGVDEHRRNRSPGLDEVFFGIFQWELA